MRKLRVKLRNATIYPMITISVPTGGIWAWRSRVIRPNTISCWWLPLFLITLCNISIWLQLFLTKLANIWQTSGKHLHCHHQHINNLCRRHHSPQTKGSQTQQNILLYNPLLFTLLSPTRTFIRPCFKNIHVLTTPFLYSPILTIAQIYNPLFQNKSNIQPLLYNKGLMRLKPLLYNLLFTTPFVQTPSLQLGAVGIRPYHQGAGQIL